MPAKKRTAAKTAAKKKAAAPARKKAAAPAKKKVAAPAKKARAKTVSRICSLCGTTATCADGAIPPGWSIVFGRKGIEYQCSDCVRRNIRAIEGKLPQEWWE